MWIQCDFGWIVPGTSDDFRADTDERSHDFHTDNYGTSCGMFVIVCVKVVRDVRESLHEGHAGCS